jgi:hypothetical protein
MRLSFPQRLERRWHAEARRQWPLEAFAYLLGTRDAWGFSVEDLWIPPATHLEASEAGIYTPRRWLHEAYRIADEEGLTVLGDIHTHPRRFKAYGGSLSEATPSEGDYATGWSGLCGITNASEQRDGRIKCRTRFYGPIARLHRVPERL